MAEIINARQFRMQPLPEIEESNDSDLCRKATEYILKHQNRKLTELISNPDFNANERFDTSYTQRENYIGYSMFLRNYEAAYILLGSKKIILDNCDMQDVVDRLTLNKKYIALYKTLKLINPNFGMINFINGCASVDAEKIYKK